MCSFISVKVPVSTESRPMGSPNRHLSSISNVVDSLGRWQSGCHCHGSRLTGFRPVGFFLCGRSGVPSAHACSEGERAMKSWRA